MLTIEELQKKIANSELGQEWADNPLISQNIWALIDLGYTEEECKIRGIKNISFEKFNLPWLKLLSKLTALATAREKHNLTGLTNRIYFLRKLDTFLIANSYTQPELITDLLLKEFIYSGKSVEVKQSTISYVVNLWAEEGWLKLTYTNRTSGRI